MCTARSYGIAGLRGEVGEHAGGQLGPEDDLAVGGGPVGSIGPTRGRCLDRMRQHPAIAALITAESAA